MSPSRGKKKTLIIALITGLLVGGVFLAVYVINGFSRIGTDDAYITGRIHNIAPKIPGTIKAVRIEDNQNVKKGDILVEIDPVDYELKVNEARAIVGVGRRQSGGRIACAQNTASIFKYKDKVRIWA